MQRLWSVDSHGQESAGILPISRMKALRPKKVIGHQTSFPGCLPQGCHSPSFDPEQRLRGWNLWTFLSLFMFLILCLLSLETGSHLAQAGLELGL